MSFPAASLEILKFVKNTNFQVVPGILDPTFLTLAMYHDYFSMYFSAIYYCIIRM
jgi:hypothetical protein